MSPRPKRADVALDRRRLLATAAGALVSLVGARAETAAADWTFTDDFGETITRPSRPERIVAYLPLAAGLWDFGVRPIAIYGTTRRPDGTPEIYAGAIDLDTVEALGEAYGELDLERFVALAPDRVVNDKWTPELDVWGLPAPVVSQIKTIAPIVNISFVEQPVTTTIGRIEELAIALGADVTAPPVVAARTRFDQASAALAAAIAEKPGLRAIFLFGNADGLYVGNPRQMADLAYFQELGLDVVQPETTELWEQLSWEQAAKYPADLFLTDARAFGYTPEQFAEVATWRALPAAQAGQVDTWQTEYVPSYGSFALVLEDLAEAIRGARADVV